MSQSAPFRNDIPFIKDLGVEFISTENGRAVGRRPDPRPRRRRGSDGEVRDTDDRLIAKAMGTFKYLKLPRTD